jgi:hypothetical protein
VMPFTRPRKLEDCNSLLTLLMIVGMDMADELTLVIYRLGRRLLLLELNTLLPMKITYKH